MVDKAIETEEETEVEETEVIDGEEQPTSEPVPLESFLETKRKLTGKVDVANTEAEEANRRAEMLEEQVKLLTLKNQQTERPDRDDFDSKVEYNAAADAYEDQRITAAVQKQTGKLLSDNQTQAALQADDVNFDTNLTAHYERAGELKMTNYVQVQNKAIDILGPDITKFIINKIPNSEAVLANLGINPSKALMLAQKVAADPTNGAIEILRLSVDPKLDSKLKSKSTTLDPEVQVEGGESGAAEQFQRKYDKALDDVVEGTATMQAVIDAKKAASEAGVKLKVN